MQVGVAPVATPLPAMVTILVFSEQLPLTVTPLAEVKKAEAEGVTMVTTGPEFRTVTVALGPAAAEVLPAASVTTPDAMLMLAVPSPVQLLSVTVRVERPVPVTALVAQLAAPVVPMEMSLPVMATDATVPMASANVTV